MFYILHMGTQILPEDENDRNENTDFFLILYFIKETFQMKAIPGNYYNFHPGSHVGQGVGKGIGMIADGLNRALFPEQTTTVLLETMAEKARR